ncbi:cyclin-dependent protein kinase inhibitor SMR6 [Apium graveolens]|uniref:cyclin-dependent protein kinase inhibitor SMR6 n=1 Tax=Apium graveolens TaxID=4045 RepID=UPI003D7B51C3
MGLSKKHQTDEGVDSKKWVIAGIAIRAPLRCISTKPREGYVEEDEEKQQHITTPTAKEARIPKKLKCPPAPRKQPQTSSCQFTGVREFFTPPDLESVFIRRVERAN